MQSIKTKARAKMAVVIFGITAFSGVAQARYIESDPIGLQGGSFSTYAYVNGNPVRSVDPKEKKKKNLYPPDSGIGKAEDDDNPPGVYSVGGHGTSSYITDPNGAPISPSQLADMIRGDSAYKSGQTIELHSCNTGNGADSFAQQLSNIMNAPVRAPDDLYWAHWKENWIFGTTFKGSSIGPTGSSSTGHWVTFIPASTSH